MSEDRGGVRSDAAEQFEEEFAPGCNDCGATTELRGFQEGGLGGWLVQWICPECEPERVRITTDIPDGYEVVPAAPDDPDQLTLTEAATDGGTETSAIERAAPSAADSYDSAIQYVAFDLLEAGFEADQQREVLEPVEEEIREHLEHALRDGMRRAFQAGPSRGAASAIEDLTARLSYDDVPEEYREDVARLVEERLEEKVPQLAEIYEDLISDVLKRASVIPEDQLVNWGPVV